MTAHDQRHPASNMLLLGAAVVIIIWGIGQAQPVLVAMLVSVFLAVLATPPLLWLERRRVPTLLAVALVVVTMVTFLFIIGAVVGTSINSFYAALPDYQVRIQGQVTALRELLASRHLATPEKLLLQYANPAAVMNLTATLFTQLGSTLSDISLIVLTVPFILLETSSFPIKLRAVLGDPHQAFPKFTVFIADMKRYMVIKSIISLVTAVLVTLWLWILGVDFPILWGFLAFLLNYVPTIGSTLASLPAMLLAYVQFGLWRAMLVGAGFMLVNLVLDYGVEKRWMGRKLGLSTLVVFLSLIFWGSVLGPVGAVLCVPLTMALKFAFESSESTRWIAVVLGPE